MIRQEKIEYIRQKCIEANQEIVKRRERFVFTDSFLENEKRRFLQLGGLQSAGGIVLSKKGVLYYVLKDVNKSLSWYNEQDIIIVGRPIRLADVIHAVDMVSMKRQRGMCLQICEAWKMANDDLTEQSEEAIDLIHGILHE
jgi:hypothetical protein